MADKDINIHVNAKADEAKQKLDQVAASTRKVGDAGKEGARGVDAINKSAEKSGGLFSMLTGKLVGMVAGVASIQRVTRAIQEQTRALEENAAAAIKQQNANLRLQFLGDYYKEKPELRKEVAVLAEFGRRPFEEVADAAYNLRSKNAAMSEAQRMSIMTEALEMGRTDPSLPLNNLVDMFSLYAKQSGTGDANRIQNVLQQAITEAGGSGVDVARYLPQFLPVGTSGGLSGAQAAGLWSYVTTQFSDASTATTGLRATFMGLQGKGNPEAAKILDKFGVTGGMDFMQKIGTLSGAYQGGRFGLAEAEQIAGREGAAVFLSMLKDPAAMMRTIGNVVGADRSDIDITRAKIEGVLGSDAISKSEEDIRQFEINIENTRASDERALKIERLRKMQEAHLRKAGEPEWIVGYMDLMMKGMGTIGMEPETIESLMGYTPEQQQRLQDKGLLPEGSPVYVNTYNSNVIYHTPIAAPLPRSAPDDLN